MKWPSQINNILFIFIFFSLVINPLDLIFAQDSGLQVEDSTLQKFKMEDLVKIKKLLEQERQRLINEQEKDLQQGVDLSKGFLNKTKEENENQDMILIRVAEYYIEESNSGYDKAVGDYNKKYEEYEKQLAAFQKGDVKSEPAAPQFPRRNYEKAISIYDLILTNFPGSELADDALYNKAYLLGQMGESEASHNVYRELIDKYPESQYTPEAYINLAEYYFQPKIGQDREETIRNLNKAAQLYKNVLNYKDSPRYDEALYKLGWTYYRLAGQDPNYYSDAIVYFTMVVKDVEKFKDLDPDGKYIKSNIEPEALQYIAASFVDSNYTRSGVDKASGFIKDLGAPQYGVDIFSNMGDIYTRIVDYNNGIKAYQTLLEMYPDYAFSPMIRKKIADVYQEDNQPDMAFNENQKMFDEYNPKSQWFAALEQRTIPDRIAALEEATQLTEAGLRSNLIYKYDQAENLEKTGGDSLSAYREFAKLADTYLETYPTNENAYEINWSLAYVLDTELHDYNPAFEEYIRVSNDYLETNHRKDAATNAIAVAQTLTDLKRSTMDTAQIKGVDLSEATAQELNPEEKLLAEAFDNYIKLFPDDEKTASYLANAGALYYQHHQYDLARKYYKTMVTKFPEAQQKSVGLMSLMNSYFFLGKFKDAEFVAHKALEIEGIPDDQKDIAKNRIGESIYKNAEKLEQEQKYLEAAREFYRVYTDARYYSDIMDLALFNSGRNYETAKEWQQSISVYDTLVANFPESKYRLIALGHIADDYKQMEDYAKVGNTYERIYELYPERKDAEAALYNSSLFFARANSWSDAIRVNNKYIARFPDSTDSKDLLFENARYYLKLDDLPSANRIYEEFATRHPNDTRTIEALYRRGEYYFENGKFDLAKPEFQKAVSRSEEFSRTGRDPNVLYASEAYFKLGEIEFEEFRNIKLSYPESNLRAQLKRKTDKLASVVNAFNQVVKMGSLKGFEAMYKIAETYEVMANDIANQELAPNLSADKRLVERDQVFKASVPAYDRAVEEYKKALVNIPILAEKLEVVMFDTSRSELESEGLSEDTTAVVRREVLEDSTREVALRWYRQAENKISLILYTVAEQSEEFIRAFLRQENPATGIQYLSWKKLLLQKAVAPAVNVTLNSHLKNINRSRQLKLDNKYVHESERKILLTSDILADEYGKLVKKAVQIYQAQLPTLNQLIEGGEKATTPAGLNSMDFNDQMLSIIDYMNEFLSVAIDQYNKTLTFARDNQIHNDAVSTTQDRLFNLSYESGVLLLDLAQKAEANRDKFIALSDSTGDQKYQLGMAFFYDHQSILKDYAQRELELSYQISKNFDIKNVWTNLMLAKLVELKPAEYLGDLPREVNVVKSDSTWLASKDYNMDWTREDFDDSGWKRVSLVNLPLDSVFAGFDTLQSKPEAIWLYGAVSDTSARLLANLPVSDSASSGNVMAEADSISRPRSLELEDKIPLEDDTLALVVSGTDTLRNIAPAEPDTLTAYFRKHFSLRDRVINGWVLLTGDDNYHFYLNGEYIKGDDTGKFQSVDRVGFIEISDFLKVGENVIGVDVTDFDGRPHYGLRFFMHLELLPGEITSAAERIRRQAAESVDMNQMEKVAVLNKNRIIAQ
ncbi:MAG: tetratricopeptide repeat protein [Calditrichia bacterium]